MPPSSSSAGARARARQQLLPAAARTRGAAPATNSSASGGQHLVDAAARPGRVDLDALRRRRLPCRLPPCDRHRAAAPSGGAPAAGARAARVRRRSGARSRGWRRRSPRRRWPAGCAPCGAPSSRGGLGLHQVVDARRAAADLPARPAPRSSSPGIAAQQLARLGADALRVGQVAGVVVGDRHAAPAGARRRGSRSAEQLGDVAHLRGERGRALGPLGVVAQQVAVVLHRRAAARRVDHHGVVAARTPRSCALAQRRAPRRPRPRAAGARRSSAARRGAWTSKPSAASTRAVAALTSPKNTRCTQPWSSATRAAPLAAGRRALGGRRRTRVAQRRLGRERGERAQARQRPRRRRASRAQAERRAPAPAAAPARAAGRGGGTARRSAAAAAARRRERVQLRSTCARVSSISLSYCTPDGQAVTHAMQPRQRSKCVTIGADSSRPPRGRRFISTIRPRGESISSPQSL